MTPVSTLVAPESVAQRILLIRGHKVMIDADLADLYGVPTKALNQAVHRNLERLPSDFMYQLTVEEKQEELARKELARKISSHNQTIACLIDTIRQLMQVPDGSSRPIGFTAGISKYQNK